jgi:TolB-like protein/tetratricopeptide (TPR) repeat protein
MKEQRAAALNPVQEGFRFGRFELDVRARELLKDGVRTRLQDQPFEVLAMLIRQPGTVLTREELHKRLWPEGTFVDFEHGLNAAVKRLRSVLGDNADAPSYVETVHRLGYRFIARVESIGVASIARVMDPASNVERKPRLAVLPFADLGDPSTHGYFSEGLTEEMITQLGRLCANRLGVIARTSSMLVMRSASTAREIGRALRVDYLVEGSVRRDGDRVRVTAKLIETDGETQVWGQSYERHLADCFKVQSELASEIGHSLTIKLLSDPRGLRADSRNVAAQQAYLKGRYHWNKPGATGAVEAVDHLEQAVRLDPEFAAAYATLSRVHVATADYYMCDPATAYESARTAAARALALDPDDSDAHLTMAEVLKAVDWDWSGAERAYRSALSNNPSNEGAHRCYGLFLAVRGHGDEAAASAQRARDLDPFCLVVNTSAAWVGYLGHQYERAIEMCRHTLDMDDRFFPAHRLLAASLLQLGRMDDAVAAFEQTPEGRTDPVTVAWLAHALGRHGDSKRAAGLIEWLAHLGPQRYVSKYHLAIAQTGAGDFDGAIASLAAACEARDPSVLNLAAEPRFEPLGSRPGYRALVERLSLQ